MKMTSLYYLLLLAWTATGSAQPAAKLSQAPVWRQSQETNSADAYNYTRFTLMGRFTAGRGESAARPALAVDCIPGTEAQHPKGRFLAANLLVGSALKVIYVEPSEIHGTSYFPKVVVRYRADEAAKPEKDNWSPGADKASTSVPRDALKAFLRARTVAISADDDHGRQMAMQFDMPDPTPVAEGCNLDVR
jgi:hypothetical protein